MQDTFIVVERLVATDGNALNLREDAWSIALDQRAFGPRRVLVALADSAGQLLEITHTERTDPPELAFALCLAESRSHATTAVAYCDEPVTSGPPGDDLAARFARARASATAHRLHLVDWFACDDQMFRSFRLALEPDAEWWNVP